MSTFVGCFANLTGQKIGPLKVIQIAGRDRQKAPVWECECQACLRVQLLPHVKLTNRLQTNSANETLFCDNAACLHSRSRTVQPEGLADVRRRERQERNERERIATEQRERLAKEAARRAAVDAALAPMRQDWHRYVRNQINAGTPVERIMNFKRWQHIGDSARSRIMELVRESESQR